MVGEVFNITERKTERPPPLVVKIGIQTPQDFYFLECAKEIGRMMTERYPCARCGSCCQDMDNIMVLDEDIDRIAIHLGLAKKEFKSRYLRRTKGVWYFREDTECAFLDSNHMECKIHSVRPAICRAFPYEAPWFISNIFQSIKTMMTDGTRISLPAHMGDNWPCRLDLWSRTRDTIRDFFSDDDKLISAQLSARRHLQEGPK